MKMNDKIIPIFFACDNKYYKFTAVTLKSIMENASKDYNYKAYILNVDIDEENKKLAYENISDNFELEFVDVSSYYNSIKDKLPVRDYYTKTTYFRLFIAEMFKQYDKAIYIDSDVIVPGDISEFYNHELGNNLIGGCTEQAMEQIDLFGTYVEKNLGLDRHKFFNAGHILINCKLFREECVLEQFLNLLNVYECKVTQDEDYLNIICFNRVTWIDNAWNTESFGDLKILCKPEEAKMIHYLMWGKPWKCDSQFSDIWWKYAKMTPFYDQVLAVRNSVTEESLKKDMEGYDGLVKLANEEIQRIDTFVNCKSKLGIKSVDRLKVLRKIEEYELEGKFDQDVEQDPPSKELLPDQVDYERKKIRSKIKTKFAYFLARKFLNKQMKEQNLIIKEIKGIENLKNLDSGAILTSNHFNAFESFAIQVAYEQAFETSKARKKRRFFRVIREGNYTSFGGFYGLLMRNCYTLPLSSNTKTMVKFMRSMNKLLQKGNLVLVYPEQSMWWNYRKPKPLKKGAFQFAVKANVPVVPIFITMEDSDKIGPDGFKVQEYTIHISEPIYPDKNKTNIENVQYIMDKNYEVWKEIYESVYHTKLEYTTQARA
ncbi:MAG: 1-acyl-sn-glycerol-3-phosphate acyltransferase [Acholeplasmatales bacterium]|nr:1-acyl-sn-glycerol-3-phosphate acyltransferase [Acholeplasmatales bacterium]